MILADENAVLIVFLGTWGQQSNLLNVTGILSPFKVIIVNGLYYI